MAYTRTFQDVYNGNRVIRKRITTKAGSNSWSWPFTHPTVTFTGTRSGEKVQDYKRKIREGVSATSAFTCDRRKLEIRSGEALGIAIQTAPTDFVREEVWFDGILSMPSNQDFLFHNATSLSKAEATAKTKLLKKIREEQQHMNSPAVLAEILDVIRQFGAPFEAIVDLTNRRLNRLYLERRRLSGSTSFKRIKWHEIVASTYLEWAFGLQPLISDTRSAAEALARFQYEATGEARLRKRVQSRGIDSVKTQSTESGQVPQTSLFEYFGTYNKTTECRVQWIAGLSGEPTAAFGSNDRLLELLGFKPENWIPAIWEAVPWSWLIDYFSNVGDILEAGVTNTSTVTWLSRTVTYRTEVDREWRMDQALSQKRSTLYGYQSCHCSGSMGGYKAVRTTVTREIPTSIGVVPLTIEHPFESARKLTNMAAVLLSRRSSSSALWLF